MTIKLRLASLSLLLLAGMSCNSRTDTSEGSVLLTVSTFDQVPVTVSVSAGPTQLGSITLRSVNKDPSGTTSNLQDIEMRSYEVRYARRDTGTRLPQPLVESLFGNVVSTRPRSTTTWFSCARHSSPRLRSRTW